MPRQKQNPEPKVGKRPRVVMARLMRRDQLDDSFDREYWRRVGWRGRLAAVEEMTEMYCLLRGGDGNLPPFDRTVARLIRRKGPVSRRGRSRGRVSR
jgi:hypothetical protein